MTDDEKVMLEMSRAEALVFYEWLKGLEERHASDGSESPITAENIALWRLEAQLDKTLGELFSADYEELVEDARRRVVESAVADDDEAQ